jgi:hypothetical protein
MRFLVKVTVNLKTMPEFGQKLQKGELDRSCIQGDTYCLKNDPAVGYSVWETAGREEFEKKFGPWRAFYSDVEYDEVVTPNEAMALLMGKKK